MTARAASLAALRAFEAVGRLGSLTKAARELFVTPAAVSHRIGDLEARVGARLFTRRGKSYELTAVGWAGFRALGDAFQRIGRAVEVMDRAGDGAEIGLAAVTSLAARWILPRLGAFEAAHPGVTVYLEASDEPLIPREYHPDVIITHGERPDARAWRQLCVDRLLVVTAPSLLAAEPPLTSPLDLLQRSLIHIDWRANEQLTGPTWQRWFRALGLDAGRLPRGIHVNQATLALDLAIAGRGYALVGHAIAEAELESGRLAIALAPPVPTMPYWILLDPEARERPALLALSQWLQAEADASLAALATRI
jgi:LysR family transcriptional regulator, glycine cleavage system transcriptional activator